MSAHYLYSKLNLKPVYHMYLSVHRYISFRHQTWEKTTVKNCYSHLVFKNVIAQFSKVNRLRLYFSEGLSCKALLPVVRFSSINNLSLFLYITIPMFLTIL